MQNKYVIKAKKLIAFNSSGYQSQYNQVLSYLIKQIESTEKELVQVVKSKRVYDLFEILGKKSALIDTLAYALECW